MTAHNSVETTLRRILVPLDSKIAARNTIETAFSIAKAQAAHVKVLLIGEDPTRDEDKYPPNILDQEPPAGTERLRHDDEIARRRWQEIHEIFDGACAHYRCKPVNGKIPLSEISASISSETGDPADVVGRCGRYSDLIVFPKPTSATRMRSSVRCSSALFDTGRPVLVTPSTSSAGFAHRIAIAWNNTVEASRAVAAAFPFLHRAEKVVILTAKSPHTPAHVADDLAEYLGTHGIEAETRVFVQQDEEQLGGRQLLAECAEAKADLLVMGAVKPGRFRDRVVGKATMEVLESANIPVLMAR